MAGLTDFLTFRIDVFNDQAKQLATDVYEETHGVTLRELRVLRLAYATPGITQGEVVAASRLEKTLVSKLVTALVRRQLLLREIGAEDARWVHLHLTEEGRYIVQQCNRLGKKMERSLLSVLSDSERALFDKCLERLTEQVERDARDARRFMT